MILITYKALLEPRKQTYYPASPSLLNEKDNSSFQKQITLFCLIFGAIHTTISNMHFGGIPLRQRGLVDGDGAEFLYFTFHLSDSSCLSKEQRITLELLKLPVIFWTATTLQNLF